MFVPCGSFLPSWIRIANTDPDVDPGTPLNPDPDTDPDPQHCEMLSNWLILWISPFLWGFFLGFYMGSYRTAGLTVILNCFRKLRLSPFLLFFLGFCRVATAG